MFVAKKFQTELRKILVSLIEVAQKLLALNPDAVELFKKANGQYFILSVFEMKRVYNLQ